jgi:hypothetical protein
VSKLIIAVSAAAGARLRFVAVVTLPFVAILTLHFAAYAHDGPRSDISIAIAAGHNQYNDVSHWGRGTSGRIVINANSCAPDRADPVWARNSALLGYSCNAPSAN